MATLAKDIDIIHNRKYMFDKELDNIEIEEKENPEHTINEERLEVGSFPFFIHPDEKQFNVWKYIFNREKKSVLGRTKERWGICLLFYLMFYIILAVLWLTLLYVALYFYSGHEGPWITAEGKLLGPGIAHYPPLYLINITNDAQECVESLDKLLLRYHKRKAKDYNDCQSTTSSPENCYFDAKTLGACSPGSSYGYDRQMPCVVIKLNRAYGWKPNLYNETEEIPNEIPADLKDLIQKQAPEKWNQIWLSCEGSRKKDKDLLKKISFWPGHGFPSYFYPFHGSKKHMSPLVAIQIESKRRGVKIVIRCQVWAKNLSTNQEYGSNTKFEIFFS